MRGGEIYKQGTDSTIDYLEKMRCEIIPPPIPEDFKFIGPERFRHQLVAFWYGVLLERCGLFLDMGTGKTAAAIDVSSYLKDTGKVGTTLILSPTTVLYNWEKEVSKFSDKKAEVLYGPMDYRREMLDRSDADFFILNYEALRILYPELIEKEMDMIIFDESTRIKNPQAKVTKVAIGLAKLLRYRLLLSGQPITNTPLDLFSQFFALDGGETFGANYYRFRNHYFSRRGYGRFSKWELKGGAMPIISRQMYKKAVRYLLTDCVDMPSKTYQRHSIELSGEQVESYKKVATQIISEIKSEYLEGEENTYVNANAIITKFLKLAQICSGFIYKEDKKVAYFKSNPKLEVLKEIVVPLIRERKVVIWCRFVETIKMVSRMLHKEKIGHVLYFGEQNPKEKKKSEDALQTNDKIRALVGQIRAGIGANFYAANYAIYVENEWSNEARDQSEARIYRVGQKEKVVIIDLITKGSVEERIFEALDKKIKIASFIMKDPIRNLLGGNEEIKKM